MYKKITLGLVAVLGLGVIITACGPSLAKVVVPTPAPVGALLLDSAASSLTATAIKNETVPVAVAFNGLKGWVSLAPSLRGQLSVDIASLNTGNEERDKNIASLFFEVAKAVSHQSALFQLRAAKEQALNLTDGQEAEIAVVGTLSMHGRQTELNGLLKVKRLGAVYTASLGDAWKINIPAVGMASTLVNLNKLCPQPHRVGADVTLAGILTFRP